MSTMSIPDWCLGQYCPLPRPTVSDEDRAELRAMGLVSVDDGCAWLGLPKFSGRLYATGEYVEVHPSLEPDDQGWHIAWTLVVEQVADKPRFPQRRTHNTDIIACVVEHCLDDGESDYPRREERLDSDHLQDAASYLVGMDTQISQW